MFEILIAQTSINQISKNNYAALQRGGEDKLSSTNSLTYLKLYSVKTFIDKQTLLVPSVYSLYIVVQPESSLPVHCDRSIQMALSLFFSGHLRGPYFYDGQK